MKSENKDVNRDYDAIVVGTGPGGGTMARELSKKGKKCLILEWGPDPVLHGTATEFFRNLFLPFKSLLITDKLLGMVRGIITGGSSVFFYATCFPPPIEMLKSHGVDITKEVEETRSEIPIGPLKDEMVTPMARKIMESARALGYDWKKLDKFIDQDNWRPGMPFPYYGQQDGVKWSAKSYVDEAVRNGSTLQADAKVEKVITKGGKAEGVEYTVKGEPRRAFAPLVILSAGGIGSAVILRNSGIKEAGYDFFFDPLITVCGLVDDVRAGNEFPMTCGVHMEDEGYMMTDMAIQPSLTALFSAQVFQFHKMFSNSRTLRIMVKAKDSLGGRITGGGQIRKKLASSDQKKLMKGYARAKGILQNAGAKGIYKTWYVAAHPGGTVKIGEILNSDLKTKKYDNLYVCDCSVIPEAWGLPPTMTLLALGKRLAKHLTK
ncbi:MAG: GMC family oxidoreductase [Desulfobacterales bacterium]|nr:GMC family oxidoreductase [Desulfobacterales bacterium]